MIAQGIGAGRSTAGLPSTAVVKPGLLPANRSCDKSYRGKVEMTDQLPDAPAPALVEPKPPKKPYQTPVLTQYGRVDQITQVMINVSKP